MKSAGTARSGKVSGHAALLFSVMVWGLSYVSTKIVLDQGVPPITTAAVRFSMAAVIMLPLLHIREPKFRLRKDILAPALLSGFVGVTMYFLCENFGLQYTTASTASLIIAAIPILTLISEWMIRRKSDAPKLRRGQWIGAFCSIAGVALVVGQTSGADSSIWGNLLMLGSCVCWVVFNRMSLRLLNRCSSFATSALQNTVGALALLPLTLLERGQWVPISPVAWLHLGFLTVFCSVMGYFCYNYGLQRIGAVSATIYLNLMPLIGAAGGVFILGERFSGWQLLGGAILIASVFSVSFSRVNRHN